MADFGIPFLEPVFTLVSIAWEC